MQLLSAGADHALGTIQGHLLGVWDGMVSIASVRKWSEHMVAMVNERPGHTVYLSYERTRFVMPNDDVRKLIIDTLRRVDGKLATCCVVVPGTGFRAAAVRALVSGIALMAHGRTPLACVPTLEEACRWVVPRLPRNADWLEERDLAHAIAQLSTNIRPGVDDWARP